MSEGPRRNILPTSVWVVLGGAVGAAIGLGGDADPKGLFLGALLGGALGAAVALVLGRRRGD